jgi:threonine aldolase
MKQPPHSVLCDARAHVFVYEAGGIAFHSQAQALPIKPSNGMHLRWDEDIETSLIVGLPLGVAPKLNRRSYLTTFIIAQHA